MTSERVSKGKKGKGSKQEEEEKSRKRVPLEGSIAQHGSPANSLFGFLLEHPKASKQNTTPRHVSLTVPVVQWWFKLQQPQEDNGTSSSPSPSTNINTKYQYQYQQHSKSKPAPSRLPAANTRNITQSHTRTQRPPPIIPPSFPPFWSYPDSSSQSSSSQSQSNQNIPEHFKPIGSAYPSNTPAL